MAVKRFKPYRAPWIDYTTGVFFVTAVVARRARVLCTIVDATVQLSPLGEHVDEAILHLPSHSTATIEEYVVMPDHVHLIIAPNGARLGDVVGGIKARATREARRQGVWPDGVDLWQRRFHDSMLSDAPAVERVRRYVRNNPKKWVDQRKARRKNERPP